MKSEAAILDSDTQAPRHCMNYAQLPLLKGTRQPVRNEMPPHSADKSNWQAREPLDGSTSNVNWIGAWWEPSGTIHIINNVKPCHSYWDGPCCGWSGLSDLALLSQSAQAKRNSPIIHNIKTYGFQLSQTLINPQCTIGNTKPHPSTCHEIQKSFHPLPRSALNSRPDSTRRVRERSITVPRDHQL